MPTPIPQTLDLRLAPHLQKVRDGTSTDDDVLPAIFALVLEGQKELGHLTSISAESLGGVKKTLEALEAQQAGQLARLERRQQEIGRLTTATEASLGDVKQTLAALEAKQIGQLALLEKIDREMQQRGKLALTIQIISLTIIFVGGLIAFVLFRR